MKKFVSVFLMCTMALSFVTMRVDAVLSDTPVASGELAPGWTVSNNGVEVVANFQISTTSYYSGPYSLKLERASSETLSKAIAVKIPVTLVSGKTYRINFKSTEEMRAGYARQKLYIGKSATGWVSGCRMFSSSGVTTVNLGTVNGKVWYDHTFDYTANAADLYLSYEVSYSETNARYFDDFNISEVIGSEVVPIKISNGDFAFKDLPVNNITADKNKITWENTTEEYDGIAVYSDSGYTSKVTEIPYSEGNTSYTAEAITGETVYYLSAVKGESEVFLGSINLVPSGNQPDISEEVHITSGNVGGVWTVSNKDVTEDLAYLSISAASYYSGPYSLRLERVSSATPENSVIAVKIPVRLKVGNTYRINFKSTEKMAAGNARQKLILGPSATGWISGCKMFASSSGVTSVELGIVNGETWYEHTFDYTTNSENLYLSYQTTYEETKTRYFDDFNISEVTGSEAVPIKISNTGFTFKDIPVTNITVDKNKVSWENTEEGYDKIAVYADAEYTSKIVEIPYSAETVSYTAESITSKTTYYLSAEKGDDEILLGSVKLTPPGDLSDATEEGVPVTGGFIGGTWNVSNNGAKADVANFQLSSESYYSEPCSLRLDRVNSTVIANSAIAVKIPISLTSGNTYRINFKSTEEMKASNARQKLILGSSATGWSSGCKMFASSTGVTTVNLGEISGETWYEHTFDYTTTSTDLYLLYEITYEETKTRYFDDFKISLLDDDGSVMEDLYIPNYDFTFKKPSITNIAFANDTVSWDKTEEEYDFVKISENNEGEYRVVNTIPYADSSFKIDIPEHFKRYYLSTVKDGKETLKYFVTVFPDKEISEITVKNSAGVVIEELEDGELTVSVSVENNSISEGLTAQLIVCLYKDDALYRR